MSATFVCGITAPITLYSPSGAQAGSPVGFEHPSQNGHGTRLPSMLRGCLFLNAIWSNVMALSFPFVDVEFCHAQMDGIPLSKGVFGL